MQSSWSKKSNRFLCDNLITNSEKNTFEYNFGLSFLFITTFGHSLFVAFAWARYLRFAAWIILPCKVLEVKKVTDSKSVYKIFSKGEILKSYYWDEDLVDLRTVCFPGLNSSVTNRICFFW
jgi:hypothetical protein